MIYLIRHGRTRLNADGRLRGRIDVPLDDVGVREAEALGALFAGVPLAVVVSSPLIRARATAEPIARSTGAAVEVDDAFSDRDWGSWAGTCVSDLVERFGSLDAAPGGEALGVFRDRIVDATRRSAAAHEDEAIGIVAHDAVNRMLLATLAVNTPDDPDAIPQRCGCWNRLELRGDHYVAGVVDAIPGEGRVL